MMKTTLARAVPVHRKELSRLWHSRIFLSVLCSAMMFGILFGSLLGHGLAMELVSAGPEFQLTAVSGDVAHRSPDVAMGGNGHAMVVWTTSNVEGAKIAGLRYGIDGSPISGEYELGSAWELNEHPAVAMDSNGNSLVVWDVTQADWSRTIVGQRYDPFGVEVGPTFEVTSVPVDTIDHHWGFHPDVAMDANGNALVVWCRGQDGVSAHCEIYGQRYDATGASVGSEFLVNSELGNYKGRPTVAMDASGNAMVIWGQVDPDSEEHAVFARRFNSNRASSEDFKLKDTGHGMEYSLAMNGSGNAVFITRQSDIEAPFEHKVMGQLYDAVHMKLGPEFQVNSQLNEMVLDTFVAMDDDGNFVVTWQAPDAEGFGVFARMFDAIGSPAGSAFPVNMSTQHNQSKSVVAMGADRNVMVVWRYKAADPAFFAESGIVARRYSVDNLPVCHLAQARPAALYSNDQLFKTIQIDGVSDPDGDPFTVTIREIYQDEPISGLDFGFASPDGQGIGTNAAEIRSEYGAKGNGRQYRIGFIVKDDRGGLCAGKVYVRVIKNKMDWDWIIYDSTVAPYEQIAPHFLPQIPTQRGSIFVKDLHHPCRSTVAVSTVLLLLLPLSLSFAIHSSLNQRNRSSLIVLFPVLAKLLIFEHVGQIAPRVPPLSPVRIPVSSLANHQ